MPGPGTGCATSSSSSRLLHRRRGDTTGSGGPIPSAPSVPMSCASTRSLTSRYVDSARRISTAGAFCSMAVDSSIVSPIRTCWPAASRPKWTTPVATPVRFTSRTAQTRSSSSFSSCKGAQALRRRLDRPDRVVLVAEWEPEDGDDRIADDLLDAPAVRLEYRTHHAEVAVEDLAQRLGIESFAQGGRALQVRGHDGHDPSTVVLGASSTRVVRHIPHSRAPSGFGSAQAGHSTTGMGRSLAIVVRHRQFEVRRRSRPRRRTHEETQPIGWVS